MKLYTEEEVRKAIRDAYWCCSKLEVECVFDKLTPIKLPSDEEIDKMWPLYYTEFGNGLNEGAKQMRDKIQGGDK